MHTYSVQLRISGEGLRPDEITECLGVEPNQVRREGQPRSTKDKWTKSMWSYDGSADGQVKEWSSLEEGLCSVMLALWSKRPEIGTYLSQFDVIWWCGHFQSSFDGGPTLSVALLERLAEFGVPVYIDNYFLMTMQPNRPSVPCLLPTQSRRVNLDAENPSSNTRELNFHE